MNVCSAAQEKQSEIAEIKVNVCESFSWCSLIDEKLRIKSNNRQYQLLRHTSSLLLVLTSAMLTTDFMSL